MRSLREAERLGARRHIPADGADGAAGAGCIVARARFLREFETEVALFHDARRRKQANAARDEDRLRVAVAERLELAQPAGENGRDVVERQLGVNVEQALGLARGEVFLGTEAEAALEFRQSGGGQGEADGEGVAAEAREEIGAALDGGEQMESRRRSGRSRGRRRLRR